MRVSRSILASGHVIGHAKGLLVRSAMCRNISHAGDHLGTDLGALRES